MNANLNNTVSMEVRDYVARVRAALADLPPEDVDEFTTGMEADLGERLAEPGEGTLRDRLGEPLVYAAELRSAAGLPPRVVGVEPKKPVSQRLSNHWSAMSSSALKAMPWLSDLRPLWWAVRGFILCAGPLWIIGAPTVFFGMIGAIASVVLGLLVRQRVLTGGWIPPVRVCGNVAAALLLPVAFVALVDRAPISNDVYYPDSQATAGPGLANNGEQVSNVYAYDESGRRLDKVRLFDQSGRALQVSEDFVYSTDNPQDFDALRDPSTGALSVPRDVFPLRWDARTGWERMGDSGWEPPIAIVPLPGPVPSVDASASASPTPSTSPTPNSTPTVSPTSPSTGATATPTPTPSASPSASR